jgi:hypothetical protein
MYLIWVIATFGMLAGAYALVSSEAASSVSSASSPSAMTLAMNMSQYRQAVLTYAGANPAFSGSVSPTNLRPYLGASHPNPIWNNYVVPNVGYTGSLVVVYASSKADPQVTLDIEQLAQGSALAGAAFNNTVVSPGNAAVPLPAALAGSVPNGVPVWMAQAYE